MKLIVPILVGPAAKIREVAAQHEIDLGQPGSSTRRTVTRSAATGGGARPPGQAEFLMKGSLHTDELLGAVVAKETGLRTGAPHQPCLHHGRADLSQGRSLSPTPRSTSRRRSRTRSTSVQNAIDLAVALGVSRPKVAILAAVETVTSKMPATIDAAALCKMADRGQITGGLLDGPLAFDNAISAEAAQDQGHHVGGGRRPGHPARAGSGGRQHPREAAQLPGQRRQRRPRARRARADHPDQPRRQRARADRQLRGRGARRARAAADAATGD